MVNTVGGQALNVAKLPDSSWDTAATTCGDHDFLASKQTHVQNRWYPLAQYNDLEPLERRKLFIDQRANGVTKPPVRSVNAVSIGGSTVSEMSTLTTAVSTLQTSVDMLVELGAKQNRRIAKIKKLQEDADIFPSSGDESSSDDELMAKATQSALGRGKLATSGEKRKKH